MCYIEETVYGSLFSLYSLEIALDIDVDVSFDNMHDWRETPYVNEKSKEINCGETYITNDENFL